jgi:hypothetical protein
MAFHRKTDREAGEQVTSLTSLSDHKSIGHVNEALMNHLFLEAERRIEGRKFSHNRESSGVALGLS